MTTIHANAAAMNSRISQSSPSRGLADQFESVLSSTGAKDSGESQASSAGRGQRGSQEAGSRFLPLPNFLRPPGFPGGHPSPLHPSNVLSSRPPSQQLPQEVVHQDILPTNSEPLAPAAATECQTKPVAPCHTPPATPCDPAPVAPCDAEPASSCDEAPAAFCEPTPSDDCDAPATSPEPPATTPCPGAPVSPCEDHPPTAAASSPSSGSPSSMTDEQALETIKNNFGSFDVAAEGGAPDGVVSRQDLEAIASGNYPPEMKEAAQHLLSNDDLLNSLDIASEYATRPDGAFSRDDIDVLQLGQIDQQTALATVHDNFDTFAAADTDGTPTIIGTTHELSREDLQAVLDGDYPPEMKAAAKHLLNDTTLWSEMDAATSPAGLTDPTDGMVHRDTIAAYAAGNT